MRRIAIVVSSPLTVRAFLVDQIKALSDLYEVWIVANVASPAELSFLPDTVKILPVRIQRKVSPLRDAKALLDLTRSFRRRRFDLVHSMTPKAGFLAMIAASVTRVPVRIHTFTGQVWVTRQGPVRWVLKVADRVVASLATLVLVDSLSQREFLMREGIVRSGKSRVLADGSICGVDTERFRPDPARRAATRGDLGIGEGDVVFLFLGRLKRDKGVLVLLEAFHRLTEHGGSPCRLVFVGGDEEGLADQLASPAASHVTFLGESSKPESYLAAADVLCLPSRREGFGLVVIEAASAGVPAIASRIYGITDAVIDGETGLLHTPDDVGEIVRCMAHLRDDPELRLRLGAAARKRAIEDFSQERVTVALLDTYKTALG